MKITREGCEIELTSKELYEAYLEQLRELTIEFIESELKYMVDDHEYLQGKHLDDVAKEILEEFEERMRDAEYEMVSGSRSDFRTEIIERIIEDYE